MEIFLHTPQDLAIVAIDETSTPSAIAEPEALLFVEDQEEPLVEHLTLLEQGVGDGAHVFVGKHLDVLSPMALEG
jgi:hypothetical protein